MAVTQDDVARLNVLIDANIVRLERNLKKAAGGTERFAKTVATDLKRVDRSFTGVGNQTGNIAAQFNDIAVMLASGQSPFQLAMQQSGQLSAALGTGGLKSSLAGIAAGFRSLISPTTLAITATVAALGYAVQYFTSASDEAEDAGKEFDEHIEEINRIAKAYGLPTQAVKDYGAAIREAIPALQQAAQEEALASLLKAADKFRESTEILGGFLPALKTRFGPFAQVIGDFYDTVEKGRPDVVQLQQDLIKIANSSPDKQVKAAAIELLRLTGEMKKFHDAAVGAFAGAGKLSQAIADLREKVDGLTSDLGPASGALHRLAEDMSMAELAAADLDLSNLNPQTGWMGQTMELLKELEGFEPSPYWDENHLRVGFGSDTVTDEMGRVTETVASSVVTMEGALRDLERRAREAGATIAEQIGPEVWGSLSESAKAALTSVAYNFGNLSRAGNVLEAARTGDPQAIADAILALKGLNEGVNDNRRETEAALVVGEQYVKVAGERATADEKAADAAEKEAASQAERNKQYDLSIENRIKLLDLEKQLLANEQLSAAERNYLLSIQQQLLALYEQGIPITEERLRQIEREAAGTRDIAAAQDDMKDASRRNAEALSELRQVGQAFETAFVDGIMAAIEGGKELDDVLKNLLSSLARMALQSAFRGLFGGIFDGGGLPGRMAGGPVSAGRAYVVGESGPEMFVPRSAGTVVPNSSAARAAAVAQPPAHVTLAVTTTASPYFDQRVSAIGASVSERHIAAYDKNSAAMLRSREMRGIA